MGFYRSLFYKDSASAELAAGKEERIKGLMLEVFKLRHDGNPCGKRMLNRGWIWKGKWTGLR
jgi:hypothetical protein